MLEIVGAILGFVYYRDVDGVVTGRAMNGIDLYRRKGDPEYDGSVNEGVDFIQNTVCVSVCGVCDQTRGNVSYDDLMRTWWLMCTRK